MSTKIMSEVWNYSQAKGAELLLLLALADYADSVDGQCWPAVERLSMLIRMSERNTQYLLRKLEAHGHIAIHLRASPRKTNLYQVLRPWCKDCAVAITEGANGHTGNGAKAFAPNPNSYPKTEEKKENARTRGEEGKPLVTKVSEAEVSSWLTPGSALWHLVQGLTPPSGEEEAVINGNGHHENGKPLPTGMPCRL